MVADDAADVTAWGYDGNWSLRLVGTTRRPLDRRRLTPVVQMSHSAQLNELTVVKDIVFAQHGDTPRTAAEIHVAQRVDRQSQECTDYERQREPVGNHHQVGSIVAKQIIDGCVDPGRERRL